MELYCLLAGLVVSIVATRSDTIHYTNSPSHMAQGSNYTAYKLHVPGTDGITIIEAVNDSDENEADNEMADTPGDFLRQGTKKMVYAPDLLRKFVQDYNIRRKNYHEDDESSAEDRNVIRMKQGHKKPNKQKNPISPFSDKDGWVTLEAVPWTRNKVSKWKPNKKPSATMSAVSLYNVNPIVSLENSQVYVSQEEFNDYPTKRPTFYQDHNKHHSFYDRNDVKPNRRPTPSKPIRKKDPGFYGTSSDREPELHATSNHDRWYDYGFRPKPDDDDRHNYQQHHLHHHHHEDSSRPQRPFYQSNSDRYPGGGGGSSDPDRSTYISHSFGFQSHMDDGTNGYMYQDRPDHHHPVTHPSNGDGEWVLVSSTKGYQYPARRQRGTTFGTSPTNSNFTVRRHKALKVTVLPAQVMASNDNKITTSHDGVLEISSSTPTVDEALLVAKRKKNKVKKLGQAPVQVQTIAMKNTPKADSSAVLAAVGAGMVPATMAMIMPILGRRRRREVLVEHHGNASLLK